MRQNGFQEDLRTNIGMHSQDSQVKNQQQSQQQDHQGNSVIGSKIMLIDSNEIRYEGILAEIRVQDGTIHLQNVLSFGTEDRLAMKGPVPPSNQMFPFMVFAANTVKDLRVINDTETIMKQMRDSSLGTIGGKINDSRSGGRGLPLVPTQSLRAHRKIGGKTLGPRMHS